MAQQPQSIRQGFDDEKIDAGRVTARPREVGDKTKLDRILADAENDGDRRRRSLNRNRPRYAGGRGEYGHATVNPFRRPPPPAIVSALPPVLTDRPVAAFPSGCPRCAPA